MNKCLLIFAWEYGGYHSERGTALVRRINQVAESFNSHGWKVVVIHKDQRNECGTEPYAINIEKNGIKRISVKLDEDVENFDKNVLLRKLETLYYITFHGDRTYRWAKKVIENFHSFGLETKPTYIISFYTPRVPLYLGNYFSKKLNIPWIADIQDPLLGGISKTGVFFCKNWTKSILKSARSVVHVSPEWAAEDGAVIGREIKTIRHALPAAVVKTVPPDPEFMKEYKDSFNIFYGGSLSANIQSLQLLKQVIGAAVAKNINVRLLVAGNNFAYNLFKDELGPDVVKHLGWLTPDVMNKYIFNCDCTLVIPWSKERVGIPSKFFELCVYPKPIWIIGNDLGAFKSLFSEWQHPEMLIGDRDYQEQTFFAATKGDFSGMFNLDNCKGHVLRASEIYDEYVKLM